MAPFSYLRISILIHPALYSLFCSQALYTGNTTFSWKDDTVISKCFVCSQLGHNNLHCKNTPSCPFCGQRHSLQRCQNSDPSRLLSTIEGNITSSHLSCTIIGGDLNCKSYLWGPKHSKFGEIFEGFALHNNLTCLNPPSHDPTFVGPQGTSHIDASFASTCLLDKICNWNLLPIDVFEGLDHRPITFSLQLQSTIAVKHGGHPNWKHFSRK